jgi:hypothetical protein
MVRKRDIPDPGESKYWTVEHEGETLMACNLRFFCLGAMLCTAVAAAQVASTPAANPHEREDSTSPVAYVYVSAVNPASGYSAFEVYGFAAASTGQLTPIEGSPFLDADVSHMAVNGKYLFGSDYNQIDIDTLAIEPNGALTYVMATDVVQGDNCDFPGALFFDHTGATLYNVDIYGVNCASFAYQGFAEEKESGSLTFLNYAGDSPEYNSVLKFIGDNRFAYSSNCADFNPAIYGVQRAGNGLLTLLNINPALPTAPANQGWCPFLAAADTTNHLAVPMYPIEDGEQLGPYQLAVYTADCDGNLTTTSTYKNMPAVEVGSILDLSMSPSGKLLAVAGTSGLQVFHFNGANPITAYTGLLSKRQVNQVFWDNSDHLYAISSSTGRLFVYTVTPTVREPAPGTPYPISDPENLIVQPLPLR